jgi:pimeloyl-ACP methyl ester carboxylesterase
MGLRRWKQIGVALSIIWATVAWFYARHVDLMPDRSSFIETARRVNAPMLVVYGVATPKRSKGEMQALASIPQVRAVELPQGKLAVHEEFPDSVAEAVKLFLRAGRGGSALDLKSSSARRAGSISS